MREIRLCVSIPSCRDWKASFGSSLVGLVRHVSVNGIKGVNLTHFDINIMKGASVLPRARQMSVDWAKKSGATHLLCIDDDMKFPFNILDKIFENDGDIIACNYISKSTGKFIAHGLDGEQINSADKSGLEEISWAGFGFILIKLDAIKDIPAPLFEVRWIEDRQDYIGEDFYFCGKVHSKGVKLFCDHDASLMIRHIGDHAYGFPSAPKLVREAA